MIFLLLIAVVGAGAYWAGTQNRRFSRDDASRRHNASARSEGATVRVAATPGRRSETTCLWVVGVAVIVVLILGVATGPGAVFGGPSLFGGPGVLFGP